MHDADVSVQQSVRASSPSRACVCGCGCDYDDGIVQVMRKSMSVALLNANRRAEEETMEGMAEGAMELVVAETKLWRRLDLISSSTRSFASTFALAPSKGDGPTYFVF